MSESESNQPSEQTAPATTAPDQGGAAVPSTSVTFRDSLNNAIPAIQVVTPVNKHKVLLKPFITGFEDDEVKAAMFGDATLKIKPQDRKKKQKRLPGGQPDEQELRDVEIPLSGTIAARRKTMEIMVLSVDGCPREEAIDKIGLMGKDDRDFITEQINEITDPEDAEDDKKKDSATTSA